MIQANVHQADMLQENSKNQPRAFREYEVDSYSILSRSLNQEILEHIRPTLAKKIKKQRNQWFIERK